MANKTTRAITEEEYKNIITTIRTGFVLPSGQRVRPNEKVAFALTLEANLGVRISDCLYLRMSNFVKENGKYRLDYIEQKTKKRRTFTVPTEIYAYIYEYAYKNEIKPTQRLCELTSRTIQNHLALTCEYLGIEGNVSSHSFRKFYATSIYNNTGSLLVVQRLLQHSSLQVTSKYLNVESREVEQAIQNHICLPA